MTSRPAVFLDRDGVLIENRDDYVRSWRDVAFLPAALGAVSRLRDSPFAVVIATNQSAIGRGLLSSSEARTINERLVEEISRAGGRVDALYLCPHTPEERCACRKPAPGMLLRAAREMNIDLASSFLIGDALSDIEAAVAAGVSPILVLTGRGRECARVVNRPIVVCRVVKDLLAAVELIGSSRVAAR